MGEKKRVFFFLWGLTKFAYGSNSDKIVRLENKGTRKEKGFELWFSLCVAFGAFFISDKQQHDKSLCVVSSKRKNVCVCVFFLNISV